MKRWCPVWAFAVDRSRTAARLAKRVRDLEHDLAVVTAGRDALRSHYDLAVEQRDRARSIAAELGGAPRWNEVDAEWLDELGVEPA